MLKHLIVLLLLSCFSCKGKQGNMQNDCITFNVGFESLKTYQGVINDSGQELIFFYKANFNPMLKFFDLNGSLKDSMPLTKIEKHIGTIGRISFISRDSIIFVSYVDEKIAGIDRKGNYLFEYDFGQLNNNINEYYKYYGSVLPTNITDKHNSLLFITSWQYNKQEKIAEARGQLTPFESDKKYYTDFSDSYVICKIDSIFSKNPKLNFAFKAYYRYLNDSIRTYLINASYIVNNDFLLYANAYDRNVYRINTSSMEILDTIPVIPDSFNIPLSFEVTIANLRSENFGSKDEEEIKNNCHIVNMLYSDKKEEYYFFVKTGIDKSVVDELGYSFIIYVYDKNLIIKRQLSVNSDLYIPKSAMITSKGVLIEKINTGNAYGSKTFCILDI